MQTSRGVILLAPLALLIRSNSVWTLLAVAAFATLLTPSLRFAEPRALEPDDSLLFSLRPDNLPLFPKFRPQISVLAALCAQTGIVTFFAGHSSIGAALFGAAVCAWTWWSGCDATSLNASQSFNLRIGVVAMLFMVAALIPYLRGATGFGLGSSHKYAARILTGGNAPRQRYASQVLDDSTKTPSDGNTGIVLSLPRWCG